MEKSRLPLDRQAGQGYFLEHHAAVGTGIADLLAVDGQGAGVEWLLETGLSNIHAREIELAKRFYEGVKDIPGIKLYGDFSNWNRTAVVTLNLGDYDFGEVSDALWEDYEIATRPGAHCAPLMHMALGTVEQGAVRFSFSWFNTEEEVDAAINAMKELAQ